MSGAQHADRTVVVGGGITGLAAAHRLLELDPTLSVTLLEAGSRLGGVIETTCRDGFLIERSADSFITSLPWALDLCGRLGLGDELISTEEAHRGAFVVHRGRLQPIPRGFLLMQPKQLWPMLTTPILSVRGKLRLAWEYFVPRRESAEDESLASFATRRLGRETFERLVQPLVGGIYTADPRQLSMAAAMPQMVEMEREHGGLLRAAREQAERGAGAPDTAARYSAFMTLRSGLGTLVGALAERLRSADVRLRSPVQRVAAEPDGWAVHLEGRNETVRCRKLIVAAPAPRAASLLAEADPALAGDLGKIPYAGATIVCLGYRRSQIAHGLDGFGFVVPAVEERRILAGSFSSVKFPGRAPEGCELIRAFVGGALHPELAELGEHDLVELVCRELAELLGIRGEPLLVEVARWRAAMPQYHVGHVQVVERIERRVAGHRGLYLAGNAYHGVGLPQCIRSGERAAEQVVAQQAATDEHGSNTDTI